MTQDGDYIGGAGVERAGRSQGDPNAGAMGSSETQGVEAAARNIVAAANRAAGVLDSYVTGSGKAADTARQAAVTTRETTRIELLDRAVQEAEGAKKEVDRQVAGIGPGALSVDWAELETVNDDVGILDSATYVRGGTLRMPSGQGQVLTHVPLLLPLLDRGNILVAAPAGHEGVAGFVQEVVLRSFLGTGAGQLSLAGHDPRMRGTLAPFAPLRQASEEAVLPSAASSEDLHALLEDLARDVRRVTDLYRGVPHTLGEFRRSVQQPIERYRLVTILDYPTGFDSRDHDLLVTLMRAGPSCGVSFLVHHATDVPSPDGVDDADLYPLGNLVELGASNRFPLVPEASLDAGVAPGQATTEPALERLKSQIRRAAAPRISFEELQPQPSDYWSGSTAERLTAVIGRIGHEPVEITLGDEADQRHNILVTGAVGQGKSNLLMVMVHSWAVRYPPSELEMYLLDFKDGVTLFPLSAEADRESWLPHVKALGLESDRAYGSAVLEHLVAEFERRASVMRPFGDNVLRFRQACPDVPMPRVVVVIDEFQVLFEEDDDLTRASLLNLERLAKKGRAYGIHLVLASQTLSGITALLSKQDGIFAQFPIRLALKNSAAESRAVLDQHNDEAARLRYRGEVIVNNDFGAVDGNVRAVTALADPAGLRSVRRVLVRKAGDQSPPAAFNGALPADLSRSIAELSTAPHLDSLMLGRLVAVRPAPYVVPLGPESGRHLSIVGSGNSHDDRYSAGAVILQTAAASLALMPGRQRPRFVVVDLTSSGGSDSELVQSLVSLLESKGLPFRRVRQDGLAEELASLAFEIPLRHVESSPQPTYVVAFGMDRAVNLRGFDLAAGAQPIDALHALWRDGSQAGIHVLGWWGNARSYRDHLGIEASGRIDVLVALRLGRDDVLDLLGPFQRWEGPRNRALVIDVAASDGPSVIIPFAPYESSGQAGDGDA